MEWRDFTSGSTLTGIRLVVLTAVGIIFATAGVARLLTAEGVWPRTFGAILLVVVAALLGSLIRYLRLPVDPEFRPRDLTADD